MTIGNESDKQVKIGGRLLDCDPEGIRYLVKGNTATQIKFRKTDLINLYYYVTFLKSFVAVTILSDTSELAFQNIVGM